MEYLSRYMVIGFLLISSLSAFAEEDAGSNSNDKPAKPISNLISAIKEKVRSKDHNPSPDGGAGYDQAREKVKEAVDLWKERISTCEPALKAAQAPLSKIEAGLKQFYGSYEECVQRENSANKYCMESRNPDMKNFITLAQVLTTGLSGMADACSAFGKVMDAGGKALTIYQTACSTMRGYCNSACGKAVKGLELIVENKKTLVSTGVAAASAASTTNPACGALAGSYAELVEANSEAILRELRVGGAPDFNAVAQKHLTCKGYAVELASAGLGIMSMLNSFGQANQCKDNTTSQSVANVDCTIPANKQNNMTCICQDAPRTPGCNTGLDSAAAAKGGDSLRAAGVSDYKPAAAGTTTLDTGGDGEGMDMASKGTDGGSSAPGAPSGGGGAGLGGGGGFGGGVDGAVAKKGNGLNANILGGEGGGGGGGGWGGRGSGSDSLRQYLPGGNKDPNAGGMVGAVVTKEVTSQGGKSNWEKVRDRYRDNKPTLLGY